MPRFLFAMNSLKYIFIFEYEKKLDSSFMKSNWRIRTPKEKKELTSININCVFSRRKSYTRTKTNFYKNWIDEYQSFVFFLSDFGYSDKTTYVVIILFLSVFVKNRRLSFTCFIRIPSNSNSILQNRPITVIHFLKLCVQN